MVDKNIYILFLRNTTATKPTKKKIKELLNKTKQQTHKI